MSGPVRVDDEDLELERVRLAAPEPASSDSRLTLGGAILGELGFTVGVAVVLTAVAVAVIWLVCG